MNSRKQENQRILVVGGGFAGLSIAARLAELGLPITLFEASSLGFDASSRNQGWLHSGALYATHDTDFAKACYQSLQHVQNLYPECLDTSHTETIYLSVDSETEVPQWTSAWKQAGIPFESLNLTQASQQLPHFDFTQVQQAFVLPDRVMQTDLLLAKLAEKARQKGVEIRTETTVTHLNKEDERHNIVSAELGTGEIIEARYVILATGAMGANLWSEIAQDQPGHQTNYRRVLLKTNLTSLEPAIIAGPFCVFDQAGFNHMPHTDRSVFGVNVWTVVSDGEDYTLTTAEKERIWQKLDQFYPQLNKEEYQVTEWSGRSVQALHIDQIEPGAITRPTVIDHAEEAPGWKNILSVYPGRATLWPQLAEQTFERVQQRIR